MLSYVLTFLAGAMGAMAAVLIVIGHSTSWDCFLLMLANLFMAGITAKEST